MAKARVVVVAGILLTGLVAHNADADIKAFHGASCVLDSEPLSETTVAFNDADGFTLFASGTTAQGVTCPLFRDRVNSSDSLVNVYVEGFNAINGGGVADYRCTLSSQSEDTSGETIDTHQRATTTIGNVQLGPFAVASSTGNEGAYTLECILQDQEVIYHVYLNESDTATD
jgi:hypothetical protein